MIILNNLFKVQTTALLYELVLREIKFYRLRERRKCELRAINPIILNIRSLPIVTDHEQAKRNYFLPGTCSIIR